MSIPLKLGLTVLALSVSSVGGIGLQNVMFPNRGKEEKSKKVGKGSKGSKGSKGKKRRSGEQGAVEKK